MVAELELIGAPPKPPIPKSTPQPIVHSLYEEVFNFFNVFLLFIPLVFVVWGIILLVRLKGQNSKLLTIAVGLPLFAGIFSLSLYIPFLFTSDETIIGYSLFFTFLTGITSLILSIVALIKLERTSLHWWVLVYSMSCLLVPVIPFVLLAGVVGTFV